MGLEIDMKTIEDILCIRLKGELDHHTAEDLKNKASQLIETGGIRHIILNLGELSFMDSSAIGVIIGRYKLVKSFGSEVLIVSCSESVGKILNMSGIKKIIKIVKRY